MTRFLWRLSVAHICAMAAALTFAWVISQTGFAKTAVQFVAPLLVVMAIHLLWLAGARQLQRGYAQSVYLRSIGTGVLMIVLLFLGSVFAPQPAFAQGNEGLQMVLGVLFCVFVIAVVIGGAGFIVWAFFKLIFWIIDGRKADHDDDERLNDGASLIVASALIIGASAEGVTDSLTFDGHNSQSASYLIDAPAADVWAAMQTATSPDFPLPAILSSFPQPVAVSVDEGTDLGATRVVNFAGREGAGALTLQVVNRSDTQAAFAVLSDSTPYAQWIGYDGLTYDVLPAGEHTRLTVSLSYERRLSPAWFFEPAMAGAAQLAMDVLARDVKTRAEL